MSLTVAGAASRRIARALVLAALALCLVVVATQADAARPRVPVFRHVLVVVLENKERAEIVGNPAAPTFNALARRPAGEDLYPHLERADLFVVAPCTANTLAKLAQGIADNVLTEAALAHRGPVLVAPAMNHRMWSNAATRANVRTLAERGIELIGPEEGELAEVAGPK